MILTCPECNTRYMVPDQAVGINGRTVRCAKCAHQWFEPAREDNKAPAEPVSAPSTEGTAVPAAPGATPKVPVPIARSEPVGMGVKLTFAFALILCLLTAGLLYRGAVVSLFPAAQAAYDMVGLYDTEGLKIVDSAIEPFESEGKQGFIVRGTLVNGADTPKRVPVLRLSALATDGRLIRAFQYTSTGKILAPGETLPFAQHVSLREAPANITLDIGNPFELSLRN